MKLNPIAIIRQAVVAGTVAGCLAAVFFLIAARPTLDEAIALETSLAENVPAEEEAPTVEISRQTQAVGAVFASVLYGALLGVVFGTVFASIRHLLPASRDLPRSALLAAAGFFSTVALPAVKYAANPPGVGNPDDVNQRTILYVTLIGAGIACAVGVLFFYRWLRSTTNQWVSFAAATAAAVVCFIALLMIWPADTTILPDGYPADLFLRFRLQSITNLAILWGGTGVGTGLLLRRIHPSDA